MSIVWADFPSGSPGLYDTSETPLLDGIYADILGTGGQVALVNDPDPNISGGIVLQTNGGSGNGGLRFAYPEGAAITKGFTCRLWMAELPSQDTGLGRAAPGIEFRDVSNNVITSVSVSTTGQLIAWRGSPGSGTELGRTALPVLTARTFQHIEVKATQDAAAGAVEVRVEGVPKLVLTGVNTGAVAYAQMVFGTSASGGQGPNNYWKDTVHWNALGSSNNDFLGSVQVFDLALNADVSLGWTPSTGTTGWDLLDEAPPNDTDYIYAVTPPPAPSIFTFGDLPGDIVGVRGLVSIGRLRKTDGGDGSAQMAFISAGDVDLGTDYPVTTAFKYYWDVSELSPDTGIAWTPIEVNAAEVQIDRTI